ncbi:thioredoxin [Enterococcus saigonensis]|uniref:Thioredoxin n=1 Tax=Enterococcus saigonensis TaxID=1805431 RepID=A0A679IC64_9ENTE|nr:DsbA family protein [Enterococcus saigonensis]BCA85823.1 thioredoxin [Enterococcus saigonensis]
MDISIINANETNTDVGIMIGNKNAKKTIIEFINLRCPYCRQWFLDHEDLLKQEVANGNVKRVIKLYDKEKESLQRGNVMHQYITKGDEKKALADIKKIFLSQDSWGNLSLDAVAEFAENNLKLVNYADELTQKAIRDEAKRANIQFVPTMIIDNHIFDESISETTLLNYLHY